MFSLFVQCNDTAVVLTRSVSVLHCTRLYCTVLYSTSLLSVWFFTQHGTRALLAGTHTLSLSRGHGEEVAVPLHIDLGKGNMNRLVVSTLLQEGSPGLRKGE